MQSDRRIRHVQIGKIEEEIEGGPNNSDSPHSQQMDPLPGPFRPKYPKGAGKAKRSLSSIEKETGSVLESYLSIIRIGLDLVRQRHRQPDSWWSEQQSNNCSHIRFVEANAISPAKSFLESKRRRHWKRARGPLKPYSSSSSTPPGKVSIIVTCGEAQQVKEWGVSFSGEKESHRVSWRPNSHGINGDWTYQVHW